MNIFYKTIALSILFSSSFAMAKKVTHLISEQRYTCVFGEDLERCWGKEWKDSDWEAPLSLGNVSEIASTEYGFCAIVQEQIKCAYYRRPLKPKMGVEYEILKGIKRPIKISAHDTDFCAIDDEGVKCWGRFGAVKRDVYAPRFKRPSSMLMVSFLGSDGKCVIDGTKTRCWGEYFKKYIGGVRLTDVVSIAVDHFKICGLTLEGEIKCQDNNDYIGADDEVKSPYTLRYLRGAKKLLKTRYRICVLADLDVQCLDRWDHFETVSPVLKNPFLIAGGARQTCVADDEGIECWGEKGSSKMAYIDLGPTMSAPNFVLKDLHIFLEAISKGSSPARTLLLSKISKYAKTQETSKPQTPMEEFSKTASVYTLAKLLSSAIESGDSDYYRSKVIPAYQKSMDIIELELGIYELAGVPDLASTREAALKVIQSTVSVINEFLSSKDREKLSGVLRALGAAISNPMSDEKVSSLLDQLIENESIFGKLGNSRKANFLTQTLSIAQEFLENKVR